MSDLETSSGKKSFQEYYPDNLSYCYGCGRLNEYGLHIRSYWDGDEAVCTFTPKPFQLAVPGFVYGGLIASVIDCHCTGTASAAAYRAAKRAMGTDPPLRFVTASLHINYLHPMPIEVQLEVCSRVKEVKGRKVVMSATLSANGEICAEGEVAAVQMPDQMASPAP